MVLCEHNMIKSTITFRKEIQLLKKKTKLV